MDFREFNEMPMNHKVMQLYLGSDLPISSISQHLGKSTGDIYRTIHKNGGPSRRVKRHEVVLELLKNGLPTSDIARMSGYSDRHVRRIAKR